MRKELKGGRSDGSEKAGGKGRECSAALNITERTHRLDHHGRKLPHVGSQTSRGRGGPGDSIHALSGRRGADGSRKQQNR